LKFLRFLSVRFRTFSNGTPLSQKFDLIITDIFMPNMDGFEFVDEINNRNFEVPIIAMSGGCKRLEAEVMLSVITSCGIRATLTKPFTQEQLLDAVNVALKPTT
jgi:CheY-like chemotaxis protein